MIVGFPGQRTHVLEEKGAHLLCDPSRDGWWMTMLMLDEEPSCGWCKLILKTHDTEEENV